LAVSYPTRALPPSATMALWKSIAPGVSGSRPANGICVRSLAKGRSAGRDPELQEAIDFHRAIVAEGGKALVGYETAKTLANVVLLSEIPTTYDKNEQRQVNAGNLLLRGVPGVGKTFFGVILAAISTQSSRGFRDAPICSRRRSSASR